MQINLMDFLLTNWLCFNSCVQNGDNKYKTDDDAIKSAGIFGAPMPKFEEEEILTSTSPLMENTELSTISSTTTLLPNLIVNKKLEFYEGWDPKHYR